jgi:hypothetical protein
MHRLMVVGLIHDADEKFQVIADSADVTVTNENPRSIPDAGGTKWEEFDDSTGYSSPYATVPYDAVVHSLGYWEVRKTGNVLDYDFAASKLSERKVITSGELHVDYEGRRYSAGAGDSMLFLVDPNDQADDGSLRPYPVRFFGDHGCTVVYTEYELPG